MNSFCFSLLFASWKNKTKLTQLFPRLNFICFRDIFVFHFKWIIRARDVDVACPDAIKHRRSLFLKFLLPKNQFTESFFFLPSLCYNLLKWLMATLIGSLTRKTGVAMINAMEMIIIVGLNRKIYWNLLEAAIKLNAERWPERIWFTRTDETYFLLSSEIIVDEINNWPQLNVGLIKRLRLIAVILLGFYLRG